MPRHTYSTCAPFRAWNRLEPRPRKYDFDQVLKSEIHDPLWLLTRQWQFGEFKGEDTGSPIFAKVLVETTKMAKYKAYQGEVQEYTDDLPLEMVVERQSYTLGYKDRIRIGNHWLKLLDRYGNQYNEDEAAQGPPFDGQVYKGNLLSSYSLKVPEIDETSNESIIQSAQLISNYRLMNLLKALAGKAPDGLRLYQDVLEDGPKFIQQLRQDEAHTAFLQDAVNDLLDWFAEQYPETAALGDAWNASQLEYQFQCALPEKQSQNTVVAANEYYNGKLDWFAFDVETAANQRGPLSKSDDATRDNMIAEKVISFIPSPAVFGGMPSNRFWEFEDGQVDLGNINAETTEISKIVAVEYATMYGNNWFLVPYPIDAGTLSSVKGIVVTDVFGQKTYVEPAIQGESDDWYGWGMFNLTAWDSQKGQTSAADTRILIPPALPKIQESEPIEEVIFMRDEMANLVWAIEKKVDNMLGEGMDGHKAAVELLNYLQTLTQTGLEVVEGEETALEVEESAVLKYVLSNTVPENWIPFIGIHLSGQNRAIQLQRASMPRLVNGETMAVRPRTQLLRNGFEYDPSGELEPYVNPSAYDQNDPYFIHEEEVPRAGIKVKGTFQRARWYDGKIVQWYGHKKSYGKGEGSSGLKFDRVEYKEQ